MEGMGNTSYNPHTEKNKKGAISLSSLCLQIIWPLVSCALSIDHNANTWLGKQGLLSKFFKAEESTPPSSSGALSNLSVGNFHGAYKSPEVGSALNTIGIVRSLCSLFSLFPVLPAISAFVFQVFQEILSMFLVCPTEAGDQSTFLKVEKMRSVEKEKGHITMQKRKIILP